MFNDHLSGEKAKEHINQLIQDAENNNLLKKLGYKNDGTAQWVYALVILIAAVSIALMS